MPSKYLYRVNARRNPQQGSDVQTGLQIGQQVGKLIGGLAGAINASKRDATANQLMNTQNPPRAELVDEGVNPQTGEDNPDLPDTVSDMGTAPATGGVDEMKLRQESTKADLSNQAMEAEIAQRKTATALAGAKALGGGGINFGGGGNASAWIRNRADGGQPGAGGQPATGRGAGKPAPYAPNSSDVQNDESSDDFTKIGADFDATYGQKGLYGKYAANLSSLTPDDKGNFPLLDNKGNPIATVPGQDAQVWMARTNAARVKAGLQPIGQAAPAANPTANAPAGTLVNPYAPKDNLGIRAVPYGQYLIDPATGKVVQKNRPQ